MPDSKNRMKERRSLSNQYTDAYYSNKVRTKQSVESESNTNRSHEDRKSSSQDN